jgi:TPR repeat protein
VGLAPTGKRRLFTAHAEVDHYLPLIARIIGQSERRVLNGEAMRWYRMAADQGDAAAQTNIAWLYQNGWGVEQDYGEAMRWYRMAADQGYAPAQNNIGWLYKNGRGVAQDYSEAMRWYRKAADQGSATAQDTVG